MPLLSGTQWDSAQTPPRHRGRRSTPQAGPDQAIVDTSIADLLTAIELAHCTPNPGDLQALGLTLPLTRSSPPCNPSSHCAKTFASTGARRAIPSHASRMRPLSASDAISPAFERTRELLLARPLRLRTTLKVAAVAFVAEIGGGLGFSVPRRATNLPGVPPIAHASLVALLLAFSVVVLLLGLLLFYVSSRLQLVLVELVATRQTLIAPMWRRFRRTTWRWIGFKLLLFLVLTVLGLVVVAPFLVYFHQHPFQPFATPHWFRPLLIGLALFLPLLLLFVLVYTFIHDFALPFLALEDLPIANVLRRIRSLVAAEPAQFALYLLLRLLLGIALVFAAEIAIFLILLVSLLPIGIVGLPLFLAVHTRGQVGATILGAAAITAVLLLLVWMALVVITLIGAVLLFAQSYALVFLGGRYPLLGDLLELPRIAAPPPPPLPYIPPPPFRS